MLARSGFSAVEILVVLFIMGVLLTLSVRFVGTSSDLSRAASEVEQLISKTRFEAIKRNRSVVLEFSASAVTVFVDANTNKTLDADERLLEGWKASDYRRGVRLSQINLGGGNLMVWSPEGRGTSASDSSVAGQLRLVDDSGASRELSISAGGYTN